MIGNAPLLNIPFSGSSKFKNLERIHHFLITLRINEHPPRFAVLGDNYGIVRLIDLLEYLRRIGLHIRDRSDIGLEIYNGTPVRITY